MAATPPLESVASVLAGLNVVVPVVSVVVTWWLARRSHTREDRFRVLDALRGARNYWVPREYRDLDDALYAVTDALVPFRALHAHGELLKAMTVQALRETWASWEREGCDPEYERAGISNTLSAALGELNAVIALRVRRSWWRQRIGARRELQRLRASAAAG